MAKSKVLFEETDSLLKDGNKYLLGTDEPTYVDFSFASLAALLVFPENYGGRGVNADTVPKASDFTAEFQKEAKRFANTPTGKYVIRMYKDHRF